MVEPRVKYVSQDSRSISNSIGQSHQGGSLYIGGGTTVTLIDDTSQVTPLPPRQLSYVILPAGSTGLPNSLLASRFYEQASTATSSSSSSRRWPHLTPVGFGPHSLSTAPVNSKSSSNRGVIAEKINLSHGDDGFGSGSESLLARVTLASPTFRSESRPGERLVVPVQTAAYAARLAGLPPTSSVSSIQSDVSSFSASSTSGRPVDRSLLRIRTRQPMALPRPGVTGRSGWFDALISWRPPPDHIEVGLKISAYSDDTSLGTGLLPQTQALVSAERATGSAQQRLIPARLQTIPQAIQAPRRLGYRVIWGPRMYEPIDLRMYNYGITPQLDRERAESKVVDAVS
ncbi:unnamed protein product [Protopolystoma xenopodis]|uniref:Uncharacterized protein n=1 Tax=Protopolystoma xenopodis TaxID=117903 RepID=A0A3S5B1G5_9PLAT|nr:unnamed protein product [Protopolystoma xenopodis]